MTQKLKKFGWGYIILGIILATLGVCFIAFSGMLSILAVTIGITLAVFGIVFGVITLAKRERSVAFALRITFAALALIGGVVTAILNESAIGFIADIFCLLLIIDGAFKLKTAVLSKRYSLFGWWFMLAMSVAIISSSFIVTKLMTAYTESTTLTVIMGVIILVDGAANLCTPFFGSSISKAVDEESTADTGMDAGMSDCDGGMPDFRRAPDSTPDASHTHAGSGFRHQKCGKGKHEGGIGDEDGGPDNSRDADYPDELPSFD